MSKLTLTGPSPTTPRRPAAGQRTRDSGAGPQTPLVPSVRGDGRAPQGYRRPAGRPRRPAPPGPSGPPVGRRRAAGLGSDTSARRRADGVVAPGRIDEATLDALYRGAAALAVPSLSEGFGLPALEAMARGCPVVASKAGALPEVVGDAGVLVPPGRRRTRLAAPSKGSSPTRPPPPRWWPPATAGPPPSPGPPAPPPTWPPTGPPWRRQPVRGPLLDSAPVRLLLDVSAVPSRPAGAGVYTCRLAEALDQLGECDLHLLARPGRRRPVAPAAPRRAPSMPRCPRPGRPGWPGSRRGPRRWPTRLGVDVWHGPHYTVAASGCAVPVVTTSTTSRSSTIRSGTSAPRWCSSGR